MCNFGKLNIISQSLSFLICTMEIIKYLPYRVFVKRMCVDLFARCLVQVEDPINVSSYRLLSEPWYPPL